jgi:hypothetical protein
VVIRGKIKKFLILANFMVKNKKEPEEDTNSTKKNWKQIKKLEFDKYGFSKAL